MNKKDQMRAESAALVADFQARGGKITTLPKSRRNFSSRELELMERGETTALKNYQNERDERRADIAGRREQRG